MPLSNPQKIKLLKLYELLKAYSDEEKPLSTNQLCAMLKAEGIVCDRRTLSVDIDVLNANGFEVMRRRTRYANLFYVADRQFDAHSLGQEVEGRQQAEDEQQVASGERREHGRGLLDGHPHRAVEVQPPEAEHRHEYGDCQNLFHDSSSLSDEITP